MTQATGGELMNDQFASIAGSEEPGTRVYTCCPPGSTIFWGVALIFIGSVQILEELELLPAPLHHIIWPVALLGFGVFLLVWAIRRGDY
jgi:hypothetical protein